MKMDLNATINILLKQGNENDMIKILNIKTIISAFHKIV